jgi:uncharacterized protein with beta-barrel porin domain
MATIRRLGSAAARRAACATAVAITILMFNANQASAQGCSFMAAAFCVTPTTYVTPANSNNAHLGVVSGLFDLGSVFLNRLDRNSTLGLNAAQRNNPGGGGAPGDAEPRWRTWGEVYGLSSKTSGQNNFLGDRRESFGVVGGLAARLADGFNVGLSVDQSGTRIQVPFGFQNASMDLTQVGIHATYESGPWTFAAAAIHGFATIDSGRRAMILGIDLGQASAHYKGNITGALAEVNYYWGLGQGRIVPKLAMEFTQSRTDGFQEVGSLLPITAAEAKAERARVMIGAEVGHYWILQQHVFDVSAYAKYINNFHQEIDGVTVSSLLGSISVAGVRESTSGVDAGGMMSFGLTGTSRVYLAYDGKFRDGFTSHHGTAGLEVRF